MFITKSGLNSLIIAVVAVAVLVIAAVVLLILKPWDKKDDDKEDTRPAATQEAKTEEDDKTEAPAPSNDDTIDYKAGGISVPIPADYIYAEGVDTRLQIETIDSSKKKENLMM